MVNTRVGNKMRRITRQYSCCCQITRWASAWPAGHQRPSIGPLQILGVATDKFSANATSTTATPIATGRSDTPTIRAQHVG